MGRVQGRAIPREAAEHPCDEPPPLLSGDCASADDFSDRMSDTSPRGEHNHNVGHAAMHPPRGTPSTPRRPALHTASLASLASPSKAGGVAAAATKPLARQSSKLGIGSGDRVCKQCITLADVVHSQRVNSLRRIV